MSDIPLFPRSPCLSKGTHREYSLWRWVMRLLSPQPRHAAANAAWPSTPWTTSCGEFSPKHTVTSVHRQLSCRRQPLWKSPLIPAPFGQNALGCRGQWRSGRSLEGGLWWQGSYWRAVPLEQWQMTAGVQLEARQRSRSRVKYEACRCGISPKCRRLRLVSWRWRLTHRTGWCEVQLRKIQWTRTKYPAEAAICTSLRIGSPYLVPALHVNANGLSLRPVHEWTRAPSLVSQSGVCCYLLPYEPQTNTRRRRIY